MFRIFAWFFVITTSATTLVCAALFYISYGLLAPQSNNTYSELSFLWWKALFVSALISFVFFFVHGVLAGQALWRKNYSKAMLSSVWILVFLGMLLVTQLFRA